MRLAQRGSYIGAVTCPSQTGMQATCILLALQRAGMSGFIISTMSAWHQYLDARRALALERLEQLVQRGVGGLRSGRAAVQADRAQLAQRGQPRQRRRHLRAHACTCSRNDQSPPTKAPPHAPDSRCTRLTALLYTMEPSWNEPDCPCALCTAGFLGGHKRQSAPPLTSATEAPLTVPLGCKSGRQVRQRERGRP